MGKNNKNKGVAANPSLPSLHEIKEKSDTNQAGEKKPTNSSPISASSSEKKQKPVVAAVASSSSTASVSDKKTKPSASKAPKKATTAETENDGDDEEEENDEDEDEDDDDDDEDENTPMIVLKHEESSQLRDFKPTDDDSDDTLIIASAIFGFLLCMLCGGLLPQFGVDPQHVMLGGMLTMLGLVVYNMLCPNCGGRKSPSYNDPDSQISPFMVFLFCGCIGAMLGGMFGGVFVNLDFKKFPRDHWVRFISGK